jgi:glycosyltransferase involved in cell wall biosynthesis
MQDLVSRESHPARSLLGARTGTASKQIFHHNVWFRDGHNNARYRALLPRLSRIDLYMTLCASEPRLLRGVQFRAIQATERWRYKAMFAAANRRYTRALCADFNQIPLFHGDVVMDIDDPAFAGYEARLLASPNVRAFVVTSTVAARKYEAMGVDKPCHVIPQGVELDLLDPDAIAAVRRAHRTPGDFVVGYVAAWLLSSCDRGGDNPLSNVDHLLDLWGAISAELPRARLWLVGQASEAVQARCHALGNVVLFGRVTPSEVLPRVANFDLGLYARTADQGVQSIKIAEYMGAGVPTVAYDYAVTRLVAETGSGVLVDGPEDFVAAVVALATNEDRRRSLAAAACEEGRQIDTAELARRYEAEILDVYLP